MENKYQNYETNRQGKERFRLWGNPRYIETYRFNVTTKVFVEILSKAADALEWDKVYQSDDLVEIKIKQQDETIAKIFVTIEAQGAATITSKTLTDALWDSGDNYHRIKQLIFAFEDILGEYSKEDLEALVATIKKRDNWDDYEVPTSLSAPPELRKPSLLIFILTGLLGTVVLSGALTIISNYIYLLLLFESLIAIGLSYFLRWGIRWSNYTNYTQQKWVLVGLVLSIVVLNQYFQYLWLVYEQGITGVTFFDFLKASFMHGFTIEERNTGWVGWVIVIGLQLVIIYFYSQHLLVSELILYTVNRIPNDVNDFAYYLLIKDKTKEEIKEELSKMGWNQPWHYNQVMEAIGAVEGVQELNRME